MTLAAIAIRALLAYLFLLMITRISGKRTIGQATPIDFLAALILGDLMDDLFWAEVSASQFVVAAGVLMLTHVVAAAAGTASPRVSRVLQGVPVEVVRDGTKDRDGMRRERVNELAVAALLRGNGIADEREVKSGTLEESGQLGVRPRDWAKPAQKRDLERVRKAAR